MSNRIKHYRTKLNLTQAELAALADTSQQQIQRFEAGANIPRMDVAIRLADALKVPLGKLFPKERGVFSSASIDPDPAVYSIVVTFKSGVQERLGISSMDRARLKSMLTNFDPSNDTPHGRFFYFDSDEYAVVINIDAIEHIHFLFDPPFMIGEQKSKLVKGDSMKVSVFVSSKSEPVIVRVDPDRISLSEFQDADEDKRPSDMDCQIRLFLQAFDMGLFNFVELYDEDGEEIVFRADAVDLVLAPLVTCNPELTKAYFAELGEDDESNDDEDGQAGPA